MDTSDCFLPEDVFQHIMDNVRFYLSIPQEVRPMNSSDLTYTEFTTNLVFIIAIIAPVYITVVTGIFNLLGKAVKILTGGKNN